MSETSNIYKNQAQLEYTDYLNHQHIQITETRNLYAIQKVGTTRIYKENICICWWFQSNHQHIQITETSRLYKRLEQPGYTKKILVYPSGFCQTTSIYKLLQPLGYTKGWNNQNIQRKYLYI